MNPIINTCLKVSGYLGCLAAGALVSWYFTKQHYEKIVEEEVQSIREVHNRKVSEDINTAMSNGYKEFENIIENMEYKTPALKKEEKPYLITMETFDDADPAFEKISLEYYTEDDCLVENDEPIDIDSSVGRENIDRLAKRMDLIVIYVRNEKIGVDYEVTKIISKWSE